jgi:hypothetical protein
LCCCLICEVFLFLILNFCHFLASCMPSCSHLLSAQNTHHIPVFMVLCHGFSTACNLCPCM